MHNREHEGQPVVFGHGFTEWPVSTIVFFSKHIQLHRCRWRVGVRQGSGGRERERKRDRKRELDLVKAGIFQVVMTKAELKIELGVSAKECLQYWSWNLSSVWREARMWVGGINNENEVPVGSNTGRVGVWEGVSWWKESGVLETRILDAMHLLVMTGDKGVTMQSGVAEMRCGTISLLKS